MQHSLIRRPNEKVKLFSHKSPERAFKTLKIFKFTPSTGLSEMPSDYAVSDLNTGYYSTEIMTPNENCYLLIIFNNNPIVLRVGSPTLQFFYWNKRSTIYPYKHFDEFGTLVKEGNLSELVHGFHFYTPEDTSLGYVEVNGNPYIISVPYSTSAAGVGITVDWQSTIIRQQFGISTTNLNFKLNKINNTFDVSTTRNTFSIESTSNKFDLKTIAQTFKVYCKN